MTYDLVIPEPGSYLLRKYYYLQYLNDVLSKPNEFRLSPEVISRYNWLDLASTYEVSLDPPPDEYVYVNEQTEKVYSQDIQGVYLGFLELTLPHGYEFYAISDPYTTYAAPVAPPSPTDFGKPPVDAAPVAPPSPAGQASATIYNGDIYKCHRRSFEDLIEN